MIDTVIFRYMPSDLPEGMTDADAGRVFFDCVRSAPWTEASDLCALLSRRLDMPVNLMHLPPSVVFLTPAAYLNPGTATSHAARIKP